MKKNCNDESSMPRRKNEKRPDAINARLRANKALALRMEGHSFRSIGDVLKCDPATAYRDIDRELLEIREGNHESAETLRFLEGERLDELFKAHWPGATEGNIPDTAIVLKVMDRRAKLFGLDAPTKTAFTTVAGNDIAGYATLSNEELVKELCKAVQTIKTSNPDISLPAEFLEWAKTQ